ncbi:hypothetical protein Ndes2526B_g03840 [Nannochloris sp. 'desiccata']|nr:putative Methylglutaconyl-CoA hydratase, mitochondrial [Chlorella desiccata (nom. nud.)]
MSQSSSLFRIMALGSEVLKSTAFIPAGSSILLRQLSTAASIGVLSSQPHRGLTTSTPSFTTSNASSSAQPHLHVQLEPLDSPNDGIFLLSLTRSEAKNAIGKQLLKELQEAINNLRQENSTRCVVIRSTATGVFCSGADLKERAAMSQQESALFVQDLRATFSALAALPMPTIAAVDGFALGGGAELALACDLRVCSRNAQFAFPETRLGIIPGAGGTQRLPRIVGSTRAKELIFTGRRVDAPEALRIGLVDHFADEDNSETAALSLARDVAAAAPIALRMAKAAVDWGLETDVQTGLRIEEACYAQVLPTKDRLEGLKAFKEKRSPNFQGE